MRLETDRLLLREYRAEDLAAIYNYQTHPAYLRYAPWSQRHKKDVQNFLHNLIEWQNEQPRIKFQLAIELRSNQELLGSCGLRKTRDTAFEAELGYEIDPHHWGEGYATESVRAILKYGFDDLQLHRVFASIIADNLGSRRVVEKLGFTYEGQLRENRRFKDRWWDTCLYGLLKDEWAKAA
ncbi:MAG: GNAT family N-acetyltransferase [Anaerolineae bacterium]|nr:GNAT family N-acetyltransferase [Anaerolineae bacterium]